MRDNAKIRKIAYYAIAVLTFLYIFSIPSFSGREKWNLISYFLMGLLGAFTILYTILYSKFKFNKLFIVILAFVAYSLIGTLIYSHEFRRWLTLILMTLTMFILYFAFMAINNNRLIFKILVFAFLGFSAYFLIVYRNSFSKLDLSYLRMGDYFDNLNTIGFYFSIAFSVSLYVGLLFKRKIELLYLLPSLLFFALGFLTGSRAFILVMVVGTLTILFIRLRNKKWLFLVITILFAVLFIILINIPIFSFLKDQFDRMLFTLFGIGYSKVDTSTVQRILYPQYAFQLAGRNLLFGYGCNGFAIYSGIGTYSHNNYAEVMCNFGIIGFILYYLSFFIPVAYSFNPKDESVYIVFVLAALYLIRSFFGVTYYTKDSYLILALCYYLIRDCKIMSFETSRYSFNRFLYYGEVNI